MPYYSDNGGLIGPGKISQPRGVYDIDFSRLNPVLLFDPASIAGFASYMSSFRSEVRNPSFYSYTLDGNEFSITDGGGDMYDNGNFTFPWYAANTPVYSSSQSNPGAWAPLSYAITPSGTIDTDMIYASTGYVQSGTTHPLSMIGVRTTANQTIGFQKGGDSGADGGGLLDSGVFYNAATILGFTVYAFRRQTYNASDPSHCDLYMLIGHSSWGSVYGTINSFAHTGNQTNGGHFYMTNATNVIAITSLLSKSAGALVTTAELETVVQAWVNRLKLYYGL
jgi:hypothetical protein